MQSVSTTIAGRTIAGRGSCWDDAEKVLDKATDAAAAAAVVVCMLVVFTSKPPASWKLGGRSVVVRPSSIDEYMLELVSSVLPVLVTVASRAMGGEHRLHDRSHWPASGHDSQKRESQSSRVLSQKLSDLRLTE